MVWLWLLVPLLLLIGAAALVRAARRVGREDTALAERTRRVRDLRPTGPDQVHR